MQKYKTVLITGCSRGIGNCIAHTLDNQGYKVYAGIRNPEDEKKLKFSASSKLVCVHLDLTDSESIKKAVKKISNENDGNLFCLINNAAIVAGGPLEIVPVDIIKKVFDVNFFGTINLIKECLPLLRKTEGRIINILSSSYFTPEPGISNYAASKSALKALSQSLNLELLPFNISITNIMPGVTDTEMIDKAKEFQISYFSKSEQQIIDLYKPLHDGIEKALRHRKRQSPEKVAQTVLKSVEAKNPKEMYVVGRDAKLSRLISKLPYRIQKKLFSRLIYS